MVKGEGNRKRKCKSCDVKIPACEGLICGINFVCSIDCAYALGNKQIQKQKYNARIKLKKKIAENKKSENERKRTLSKERRPLKWWQDELQRVVNYYVVNIRDKDKPCCTCGTSAPDIKYDAGHYRTRKAAPELRYELKNIHIQCSLQCNQYGSGMRAEYREFIRNVYDDKTLEWLDGKHPTLKEQFPHWTDYEKEIQRYKKLIKELE